MTMERWEPFREMISLRDAMNSLLEESFVRPGGPPAPGGAATLPLDVAEMEGEFVIKASLPGIKPEDVRITVHGDTLTIRGESKAEEEKKGTHWHMRERRVSSLTRSLSLRTPINADAASAHFDHGVLTLTLPKTAEAKPKHITVASGPPPPSSDRPDRPAQERDTSGIGKSSPASRPPNPGGKPEPTHDVAAEQIREANESEKARGAVASNRERMVDIGRGNQQAGRQGQ
jgi:HSP20 family protein